MDQKTESTLGYPSVRRVVDTLFGQTDAPLTFTDALSGSFAIVMFAFLCTVAARQMLKEWRYKRGRKQHPYVLRRNAAKKGAVAANDPAPKTPPRVVRKPR